MDTHLLEWSQCKMVLFCFNAITPVYGMCHYDDYTNAMWSDHNHATTLQYQPMSDFPSHAQFQGLIRPLCMAHGYLDQSDAKHKYSRKSAFILTPFLRNAKLCNPK